MAFGLRSLCMMAVMLAGVVLAPIARAADPDPAIAPIESFNAALMDTMKNGPTLGYEGRIRRLTPVVTRTFDLPTMTRFAVGSTWVRMTPQEKSKLIDAFTRLTTASYANNFASFDGEQFSVEPRVETRGPDKIVQTHLTPNGGKKVSISYRMRQSGGSWKIVDVYYQGTISQLTTRRSDFAATVASGGATALLAKIEEQIAKLKM